MVRILGSLVITLFVFAANAQKLDFDALVHDFGTIMEESGSVTHSFKFTNAGDKPLIITKVHTSCGCTTPKWTKEPVKPGETGEVMATYKTSVGPFNKSLTVTANGLPDIVLYIKGNVVKESDYLKIPHPQPETQDTPFDRIFKRLSIGEDVTILTITKSLLDIMPEMHSYVAVNGIDVQKVIAKLEHMDILISKNDEAKRIMRTITQVAQGENREVLMRIKNDGEDIMFYGETDAKNDNLKSLIMFSDNKEECTLIRLIGTFSKDDFKQIIKLKGKNAK
jgi:hypothetical protein